MTPLAHLVALPVRAYRLVFSPWVGFNCRYQPTCSAYAMEALEKHGALRGSLPHWPLSPLGRRRIRPRPRFRDRPHPRLTPLALPPA